MKTITLNEIIKEFRSNYNPVNLEGMKRFGINVEKAFGLSAPYIKGLAKEIGINHELALELWDSGYHEARQIAAMIADPKRMTKSLMNKWVRDFHSWDLCDGVCCYLFQKTPYAVEKIFEWSDRKEEFIRRAGFSLLCYVSVHHKKRDDMDFLQFFPLIRKHSLDERNFVKKAVNWSLRTLGKRSKYLNKEALILAKEIQMLDSKSARWIANDAIRELTDPKILVRLKR